MNLALAPSEKKENNETNELFSFGVLKSPTAIRSLAFSFVLNGLCPYLLYRYLEPKFPAESLRPLLYASIFPAFGLLVGILRKRTVDVIAAVVLFEISVNLTGTLLASSVRWALLARSLPGITFATAFLASVLVGKPLIHFIARQFLTGGDGRLQAQFDAVTRADRGRTFFVVTLVWAVGIYLLSATTIAMALAFSPDIYLLVAQIVGLTTNIALGVWTIRFVRGRLMYHAQL